MSARRVQARVTGVVQGVGFRPHVHRLARELRLDGFVLNDERGVLLEVEGASEAVEAFVQRLAAEPPPLAAVERIEPRELTPTGSRGFEIVKSRGGGRPDALVSADAATCEECLAELRDPDDRRYRYPFINCTNCGPRFTIAMGVPYDRPLTTMAGFAMCARCEAEYEDPMDRRFHAQPNACPDCGPQARLVETGTEARPLENGAAARPLDGGAAVEAIGGSETSASLLGAKTTLGGDDSRKSMPGKYHRIALASVQRPTAPQDRTQLRRVDTSAGGGDALSQAAEMLAEGAILAVKGIGGYHLACRAESEPAVAALRSRKHREDRPFALMVGGTDTARTLVRLADRDVALLEDRARPIVIAPRLRTAEVAPSVAARCPELGVMLPYTPLHHVLLADLATLGVQTLVMTSGNLSDEPIAYRDEDAFVRLAGIADAFLTHDRPIHIRTDDSVLRSTSAGPLPIRRSRGYVPAGIALPVAPPMPLLAVGAELKSTFCVARGNRAWVSHHIGDLKNYETLASFREGIAHFEALFDVRPQIVAHDLHPDYLSTRYAEERLGEAGVRESDEAESELDEAESELDEAESELDEAESELDEAESELDEAESELDEAESEASEGGGEASDGDEEAMIAVAVQHHHAHLAAVLAEHGEVGPAIGVIFDGSGFGLDGTVWGGELLVGELRDFERVGALRTVRLPGGDMAVREPWRMACAWLCEIEMTGGGQTAGANSGPRTAPALPKALEGHVDPRRWEAIARLSATELAPVSSSVGRLFDAAAALCGLCPVANYEGQAAIELEGAAGRSEGGAYPFELRWGEERLELDPCPALHALSDEFARGIALATVAARFHNGLAQAIAAAATTLAEEHGLDTVVLAGGVFQNRLLLEGAIDALSKKGLRPLTPRLLPPGDGSIAYGQAAVAAARLAAGV